MDGSVYAFADFVSDFVLIVETAEIERLNEVGSAKFELLLLFYFLCDVSRTLTVLY